MMTWAGACIALIEPANADAPPAPEELDAHLRLHLGSYKLPRSYEIVAILPRDQAGKFRRSSCAMSVEASAAA
jgi:acyl-CoA synthetase (AMP-forming)/AMP-acid ligase II